MKDQANKKEKEWLDKKIIHESGHQEMASTIKMLQNRVSIHETKLLEWELENNRV